MMPPDPKDDLAHEWFSGLTSKLRFEQDYYIYPGSSKTIRDNEGKQTGISIKRPDVRLYSTGLTKLYEILVEGKELPDVVYTPEEEKRFDENFEKRYPELAEGQDDEEE